MLLTRWLRVSLLFLVIVLLAQMVAATSSARPATVEIVLNPVQDTYLDEGLGRAQDVAHTIIAGWTYTTRTREYRAYLRFPLDPAVHPVDGLIRAELWLYPNRRPESQELASAVRVSRLIEPFPEGQVAPNWPDSGEPRYEDVLDIRRIDWKKIRVTDTVRDMLRDPDTNYGFEVTGVEPQDNTRWEFVSTEGGKPYPDGQQPRLVLVYGDYAFPSDTPEASATPQATLTPEATATSSHTATAVATIAPTSTTTPEAPDVLPIYLPRVLNGH